jgi:ABC-type multidrug transport system fused ATPase/permease subunit
MDREAERAAFAKACAYLNYKPAAKWSAHAAAVGTGVVYVALLVVLWLFTDLMVYRGRLPTYHSLTPLQQNNFFEEWNKVDPADRTEYLRETGLPEEEVSRLAALTANSSVPRDEIRALWRAQVRRILKDRLPEALPAEGDAEPVDYNADLGIASLIVREHADRRLMTPVVSWFASWNPWMRNAGNAGRAVPPYLIGLLVIGIVLGILGAVLTLLMREMAARAAIAAASRLRRAVYHHTFRLGTLAFRALGPTEAVSIFARHIEAVHDSLLTHLTVFYRAPIKVALLLAFALCVNFWLALACLMFAALVWLIGGQVAAYFRRQGRQSTNSPPPPNCLMATPGTISYWGVSRTLRRRDALYRRVVGSETWQAAAFDPGRKGGPVPVRASPGATRTVCRRSYSRQAGGYLRVNIARALAQSGRRLHERHPGRNTR